MSFLLSDLVLIALLLFARATPEKPRSCIYGDISKEGNVKVICVPGRDGGLPQTFILEVKEVAVPTVGVQPPGATTLSDQGEAEPILAYRVLGERPEFELRSLQPGREYLVSVYAENAKGRSPSQDVLPSIKMPAGHEENETGNLTLKIVQGSTKLVQNSATNLTPIYVVLTSCAVILVVVIITAVSILACRKPTTQVVRRPKSTRCVKSGPEDFEGNSEAGFGEGFHRRSAQYRASMYGPPPEEVEMRISRMIDSEY
ncbi:hypothetical protein WA026_011673 [Henosepilachna vigintioctopunctata]|uniref:Fibronectin type-III domain-containing protein n=1 Tax=Henosepilachna vigintioctopunctata TaxID=420089 RepID=A0AAW1UL03_9CUCU